MRRTLLLGSVAVAASAFIVGCGGGDPAPNLNTASRIVVGYVYVRTNNTPQASPAVIVSPSTTPPAGYAVPTAGTVTISVADGSITRAPDSETFSMAASNAVIARVVSRSATAPTFSMSFAGIQFNGETKTAPSTTVFNLTGAAESVFPISLNSPSYTIGAAASMRVLIKDPSAMYGGDEQQRFGAPADVIGFASGDSGLVPSNNLSDQYEIAVILLDANGVVIPGTTFNVTDASPVPAVETAITQPSPSLLAVGGGGSFAEGADVTLTFTSPQAPGMSVQYTTQYSFGIPSNFQALFTPAGGATLNWPASGPAASLAFTFVLGNGRGMTVPNRVVSVRTRDTAGGARGSTPENVYPSPAVGSPLSATSATTDGSGSATMTFFTPDGAGGNPAFNGLNIKYAPGNTVDVLINSHVLGSRVFTITRDLATIAIAGPNRLDVGTSSHSSTGANPFRVTGATDIDTASVAAPTVSWNLTNTPNPGAATLIGDLDDLTPRSVSNSSISSSTGAFAQVTAGTLAGQFSISATSGTVTSNIITASVVGVPSKIRLNPSPISTGYAGVVGIPINTTVSFLDAFGNAITTGELSSLTKAGVITSSGGGNIQNPLPASSNFAHLITPTSAGTLTARLTWTGVWTGSAGGGPTPFNIEREIDVVVP